MRVPSEDELAAIAAAYTVVTTRFRDRDAAQSPHASRWALAARLPLDHGTARALSACTNRWSLAGRLGDPRA